MKHSGFTLIEMAIVLLVIILMTGFILKGNELIYQAKIKNLENQYHEIKVAVESYYDRYKYLPGDDPNSGERWYNNDPLEYKGNGNNIIEGEFKETSDIFESRKAWGHLRAAGFVTGDAEDLKQPKNTFNGIVGISAEKIKGKKLEIYVAFTNVPVDILEQFQKKVGEYITITKYYDKNGVPTSNWLTCMNLLSQTEKVDIVITNVKVCN